MNRSVCLRPCAVTLLLLAGLVALFLRVGEYQGPEPVGRLVSYEPIPVLGETCIVPAGSEFRLAGVGLAGFMWPGLQEPRISERIGPDPLRVVRDPYPSFSAVAVDTEHDEVYAADENLLQILVYDRLDNTPEAATMTEPKRALRGPRTELDFICGLYVDQQAGEVYGIHADSPPKLLVFSRTQNGDVPPVRRLETPKVRGIAVDEEHEEILLVHQHNSAVVVYRKQAEGDEDPIRVLQGDRTGLSNPHAIALDRQNDLIFVTNHGHVSSYSAQRDDLNRLQPNQLLSGGLPGTGRFLPPSITVHERTASGDTPPVRVIAGPRTQLNWPAGIVIDERRGELFIANDTGNSVLVFKADAAGDAAPIRVLKGPNTGLNSPAGIFLDTKNDELWVSNYGNHALTVYSPTADGDTPPLRTIRSGPTGSQALMIGNPGALAYDTKREELLVPN